MFNTPQKLRDVKRFEEILSKVVEHEMSFLLEHLNLKKKELHKISEKPTPERLRKLLEELGGTFVKLGQLLSLRPDLIPAEYCKEFSKLQDSVPSFSTEKVEEVVERELEADINEVFDVFILQPIASASVGQVHKAVLKSGEEVAVKVRRPGIEEKMHADIDILVYLANKIENHFEPEVFSPRQIVTEFKDYTEKELDYTKESYHMQKFKDNFAETDIIIPDVYWDYTTEDLLVMEYVEGQECKELIDEGEPRPEVATKLCNAVFKQVFEDGYFHADPHPSNIMVSENKIAFLDFGIVGRLSGDMKDDLSRLFIGMIQRDVDEIVDAFVQLNLVGHNVNRNELKQDLSETLGMYYDVPLNEVNLSDLIMEGFQVARKNKMRMPKNFVLLGKAVATLESTCENLDPDFNIVEVAKPYVSYLIQKRMDPSRLVRELVNTSEKVIRFLKDVPDMGRDTYLTFQKAEEELEMIDEDIRNVTREVSNATSRLVMGLIASSLIIFSALISTQPQGEIFGMPEFTFTGLALATVLIIAILLSIWEES